ncbi:MAG: 5-formyltetrahydrofolate cyclo-ligase [Prevotella sp.]|nr:5-formyltetrahydrofolate cyclo-ligase [Prevotella sp.]
MDKAELRKEIRRRFLATTTEQRRQWSAEICAAILRDEHIAEATTIMAFWPLSDEPDIIPLISSLHAAGKRIFLPETTRDGEIIPRLFSGLSRMQKGLFGTSIPAGATISNLDEIDFILVPGIAFSTNGNRLGRGQGCYDRFLPQLKHAIKRGVCFPFQIVGDLPHEAHDANVDYV